MQTTTATPLSDAITGRTVFPGDADWDAARQAFDLLVDQRPTPSSSRPTSATSLPQSTTRASTDFGLHPRQPGHNAGPLGSLDDTLLVHVSELTDVSIDPAARRVRVGAGIKWEKVAPRLSPLGLAGLHGSSPDVGIAGYSFGGGMGWLARKYGLQTNSVTAIELVTADGHSCAPITIHEPDLFWALRGGGGNFGVVTAIEFDVYPSAELYAGAMFFPFERASEVLHAWREVLPRLPDELMTWARPAAIPGCTRDPRAAARRLVRRRSGRHSSARRPTAASCCVPSASSGRRWTPSRWRRRPFSVSWRWTRRTRCHCLSAHALLDDVPAAGDRRPRRRGRARGRARRSRWSSCANGRRTGPQGARRRRPRDAAGRAEHVCARRCAGRGRRARP